MWTNNIIGERRSREDLIEAYKIMTGKEALQWERFSELAPKKANRDEGEGRHFSVPHEW